MTAKQCSKHDVNNFEVIIKYCDDIDELLTLHGSDEDDFHKISLQYGCTFALIQIGEHVKRLSKKIRDEHPEVDWSGFAKLRDFVAHNYISVEIPRLSYDFG